MRRATLATAIGLLVWGLGRRSCKLRRTMSRFHSDDSPGDRLAAENADLTLDHLTELYGDAQHAKVVHWRIEQMIRAGFSELRAATIAACDADWRRAIELVRSGCDEAVATDIVL